MYVVEGTGDLKNKNKKEREKEKMGGCDGGGGHDKPGMVWCECV
jgi:hypothetical protein